MNLGAIIGLVLGLVILLGAAFTGSAATGGMGSLWDATSMAIVVGGAIAATCIAYPLQDVIAALSGFPKVFGAQGFTLKDVVQDYVGLAEMARKGELEKALDETPEHMPFRLGMIKDTCRMINDGMSKDDIRIIKENNEQFRALRDIKAANAMAKMGEYAPSFGMIGTLFGLIFMLAGMAMPPVPGVDPTAALISNMAIALITTLYGALFAFFFFLPFSDHLKYINDDKKVESALHLEAAMLLYDKVHPIMVQERLNAFLARKERFTDED
jgi:chemotaxis protein MotA